MNLTKAIAYLLLGQLVLAQDNQGQGSVRGPELKTFIITFKDGDDPTERAQGLAKEHGGLVKNVYKHVLNGAALTIPAAAATSLAANPRVTAIEEDQVATAFAPATIYSYGQSRVDQCPGGNLGAVGGTDTFNRMSAADVRVYILDTGIYGTHNDFSGRIDSTSNCHASYISGQLALNDGNGHGTHVASNVCGNKYGVATCKELCAVKVLADSGSGAYSGIIAGIDFVAANCKAAGLKCVANMSLGGGISDQLDAAVNKAVGDGVTFVVAAGNDNANACNYSPARAINATTVGAIDSSDGRASFTNYGSCVDIYAPGVSITAAWFGSNTATITISGTSMASPHVCALAAAARQMNVNAADVATYLKSRASKKTIDCRSAGVGVAVNPDMDCSTTLSPSCSTAPAPATCRIAGQQCKKANCGSWTGCAGTGTSCCCCSGFSCGGSGICRQV